MGICIAVAVAIAVGGFAVVVDGVELLASRYWRWDYLLFLLASWSGLLIVAGPVTPISSLSDRHLSEV